ncbi:ATP synthase subunit b chloroplastic [Bienertia sinuspersici]
MKNVTDSCIFLVHWPSAGSFGDLLDNRKQRILNTIRNSEELRRKAIEQLEKARARLKKVEMEADQFRNQWIF